MAAEEAELNQFLAQHQISSVDKEFVAHGENSFWTVSVEYIDYTEQISSPNYRNRVDYKEILSEDDFTLFAKLRELRKEISQAEGVPAYAIFSNKQLAEIVTEKANTKAALLKISGIGNAKIEKYADTLLELLTE